MELSLFVVLVGISLVMVYIGLMKPDESAQALIGFFFLFLLSFILMYNNLQVPVGSHVTTNMTYTAGELTSTDAVSQDIYTTSNTMTFGIFLALVSLISFAIILSNVRKGEDQ